MVVVAVVAVVVVAGIVVAIATSRRPPSESTTGPTPSSPAPSAAMTTMSASTSTPIPSPSAFSPTTKTSASSDAAGQTAKATPTKVVTPYCQQYQTILAGGRESVQDEGSVDFEELSATFSDLIKKYSRAAELAPKRLKPDYAKVLVRLKTMKKAVDSRDFQQIRAMLKQLDSLNSSMEEIQRVSQEICR